MQFVRFFKLLTATLVLVALTAPAYAIPALLVDMRTGEVLHEQEAGKPWHPASLTKLMTAYVTFKAIEEGRVSLDTPVVMSRNALSAPPSKIGPPVDTAYTLEDALYLLVVKSANDVAIAIAETVGGTEANFVGMMNATAAEMGLTATHYVNPNGLHEDAQVTSARDLAVLALNIRYRYPQYAQMFATHSVRLGKARLDSHNDLLTQFTGTTGMKTGYVCESGLNIVATVERGGKSLMAVVLGGASSRERGQMAAQMVMNALSGAYTGSGRIVTAIENENIAPADMSPYICGSEAGDYRDKRRAAFAYGLEGEPSLLTDDIAERTYSASSLGRIRNVPLPRPRPLWAPEATVAEVPMPRPRPESRVALSTGM